MQSFKLPVLFIAHGSPMNLVESSPYSRDMEKFRHELAERYNPKSIVYVSSHWTTENETGVTSSRHPKQVYDFYGFPPELYRMAYRPLGNPELAETVRTLIGGASFLDSERWIDHAGWAVGKMLFPESDIPSISISVRMDLSTEWHFELGNRLSILRDAGVLIIASGNVVHNLRFASFDPFAPAHPLGTKFANELRNIVESGDTEKLSAIETHAWYAFASPTPDHFIPLAVAMWAAGMDVDHSRVLHDSMQNSTVSMLSFAWGL